MLVLRCKESTKEQWNPDQNKSGWSFQQPHYLPRRIHTEDNFLLQITFSQFKLFFIWNFGFIFSNKQLSFPLTFNIRLHIFVDAASEAAGCSLDQIADPSVAGSRYRGDHSVRFWRLGEAHLRTPPVFCPGDVDADVVWSGAVDLFHSHAQVEAAAGEKSELYFLGNTYQRWQGQ